jgi:uncharacterized protein (DUF1330 family)
MFKPVVVAAACITLAACAAKVADVKPEPLIVPPPAPPQSAYLLVQATVTDRARFGGYIGALPPVYTQYGGSYVAVAPAPTVERLESPGATQSIVISKWPSLNRVKEFWQSPEYQAVKKLREGTGTFTVVAFEAAGDPTKPLAFSDTPIATAPGLLIVQGNTGDGAQIVAYNQALAAQMQSGGASFLAAATSSEITVLEGNWSPKSVWISRWPNKDAARSMWNGSAYQTQIKPLRAGLGSFQVDLIEGLPQP